MSARKTALGVSLLLAAVASRAAEPVPPRETLSAVVARALARSADLEAAGQRRAGAQAALSASRYARLPALSAKAALTRGDDPVYAFSSLLKQREFSSQDFALDSLNHPAYRTNISGSLELGVPLFAAFEGRSRTELARLAVSEAEDGQSGAAQQTRYRAVAAHLSVLAGEGLGRVLRDRVASASDMVADARRLRQRGAVLGSDYEAAEAVLAGLKAWEAQAAADLEAGRETLGVLLGEPPGTAAPAGRLSDTAYPAAQAPLLAADAAARPDLRSAALRVDAAAVLRRQAGRSLLPRVEAFAALETDTADFQSRAASRLAGVRASLPFGDASYLARRRGAEAAEGEARARRRALEEAASAELAQARQAYLGAAATLPHLAEARDRAARSLEHFRPLYRAGRQSVLEVLRAEEASARAEAGYLAGLERLHLGYARLRLAGGTLDDEAVARIEERLKEAP